MTEEMRETVTIKSNIPEATAWAKLAMNSIDADSMSDAERRDTGEKCLKQMRKKLGAEIDWVIWHESLVAQLKFVLGETNAAISELELALKGWDDLERDEYPISEMVGSWVQRTRRFLLHACIESNDERLANEVIDKILNGPYEERAFIRRAFAKQVRRSWRTRHATLKTLGRLQFIVERLRLRQNWMLTRV